ncbi:MAG: TIGR03546 family protein [Brevinematales bacterium]|nr:TIGR03546 family protein [Brevinematales bacterium]
MFIKWIVNIFKALNSNQNPREIAAGVAFGFMLAFIPSNNLLWILLLCIVLLLRVNSGIMFIFIAILKPFVFLIDPFLHAIGYTILTNAALYSFFTKLYNIPFVFLTKFNNTIVFGGLVLGIILWIPLFILFTFLVKQYRDKIMAAIQNSKIYKAFINLPVVSSIIKLSSKAKETVSIIK